MRAAALLDAGSPDVGDAARARVKSLVEGDGHGRRSGGESDALSDRFIVALAELGGSGWAVLVRTACAGRRGGQLPGVEVEGCSWVICLFKVRHQFACLLDFRFTLTGLSYGYGLHMQ